MSLDQSFEPTLVLRYSFTCFMKFYDVCMYPRKTLITVSPSYQVPPKMSRSMYKQAFALHNPNSARKREKIDTVFRYS